MDIPSFKSKQDLQKFMSWELTYLFSYGLTIILVLMWHEWRASFSIVLESLVEGMQKAQMKRLIFCEEKKFLLQEE